MRVQVEATGQEIELTGSPLGSGGEAAIYAMPEAPALVAKVYHKPKAEHADKLRAMIAAPPADPMAGTGHASIAWPIDRLLAVDSLPKGVSKGAVAGYVMPRVDRVRLIQEFYNPKSRLQMCPLFHYGYLLRTARNLAAAVRALHERGYVIGDLNESNLLVTNQALVTLVDTDSFQVATPERTFRCTVGKPEYTPPELQGARFAEIDRRPEHDAFGLAVLIFQLLMQGMHPFAGIYTGDGEPAAIPKRIVAGHWPYQDGVPFKPSPLAPPWSVLPPMVQEMMRRCFIDGHARPASRPMTYDWQYALQEAEKDLTTCPANAQHLYPRALSACPWCALAKQQGRDPFPSPQEVKALANGPATLKPGDKVTLVAHADDLPSVIPVPTRTELLVQRLRTVDYATILKRAAAGVAFLVAAVAVAYGSWKLTHKPRPSDGNIVTTRPESAPETPPQSRGPEPVQPPVLDFAVINQQRAFQVQRGMVDGVAFSSSNRQIVTVSTLGRSVCVWDVESRKEVRRLPGMTNLRRACFSQNGRMLSLHQDNSVQVCDVAKGEVVGRFQAPQSVVTVALAGDGRSALAVATDRLVTWDLETMKMTRQVPRHTTVRAEDPAELDAEGRTALLVEPLRLVLWDVLAGKELHVAYRPRRPRDFQCAAISPDGRRVVTCSSDSEGTWLWDGMTNRELRSRAGHGVTSFAAAFSPDGRHVLSGDDRQLHLWDVETGKERRRFEGHQALARSVAFSSDGRFVLAGTLYTAYLWETPDFVHVHK